MAISTELSKLIDEIKSELPYAKGVVIASLDGVPILSSVIASSATAEEIGAMGAMLYSVARRSNESVGHGKFTEMLVRGEDGVTAIYGAGANAVLILALPPDANIGLANLVARKTAEKVRQLFE
ncbi:MAG: hypothetical protein DRQ10_07115 [Candidatus Hydrothermota bacterium]|nr:MAG: hypothetical protein DRQ10_07115 [Candidatus Hydrothermae bacterium]